MNSFRLVWFLAAGLSLACGGRPGNSAGRDSAVSVPDTTRVAVGDSTPVIPPTADPPRDSTRPTLPPSIPGRDTALLPARIADLLGSSALVGRRVQVTGTCLGYRVPAVAV